MLLYFSCFVYLSQIIAATGNSNERIQAPNIIFIVADDVGWNDVGWHNIDIRTPNLNFLVKQGVELNNSYVAPICSPSRAAILTGKYSFKLGLQHGVIGRDKPHGLPLSNVLLPQAMKQLGYDTHAVGKWHLGFCNWSYTPTFRGFDSFYGFYTGHQDYVTHYTDPDKLGYDFRLNTQVQYLKKYSTTAYAERVENIISKQNKSRPFFIYLAFQTAHPPLKVPERYLRYYKHIKPIKRKIVSGMITAMDDAVGRIRFALKERGMTDNTLIAFVSDNGASPENGGSNWPLRGGKSTLWEGGTRVPSFISGAHLKHKKLHGLFHAVDWFPTLLEAASIGSHLGYEIYRNFSTRIDGMSHWKSLLSKHRTTSRKNMIYQINKINGQAAVRNSRFKLIENTAGYFNERIRVPKTSSEEHLMSRKLTEMRKNRKMKHSKTYRLYDLENDELEENDLSKKMEYRKVIFQLRMALRHYKRQEVQPFNPNREPKANPIYWGGIWSPGWC